jgi:hypothetical protein
VASLREVRDDFFVNSYALGMQLRFKDRKDSVIVWCLYSIADHAL